MAMGSCVIVFSFQIHVFFSCYISFISYFTAKLLHQNTGTLLHLCAYEKDHSHSTTPKVAADILQSLLNDIS